MIPVTETRSSLLGVLEEHCFERIPSPRRPQLASLVAKCIVVV